MEKITTNSSTDTEKIGFLMAKDFLNGEDVECGVVIVLEGELGAGKTTFLKGFAKGLGVRKNIQSPTFIIMNRFVLKNKKFNNFFHFDCYRIENKNDMKNLGFEDILTKKGNIICIEWGSKIKELLPKKRTDIIFEVKKENERVIKIKKYER